MNKTKIKSITIIICILTLLPAIAPAQNYGPSLGIILGSPTGFTMKYVFAPKSAIAINAGWSLVKNARFHCTGDYQFLFPQTLRWRDEFEGTEHEMRGFTPYFGIGGRFVIVATDPPNEETEFHVGLRLGGGVEYAINRFGLFLEIYPVVDIVPSTDFSVEGGFGFRFYLSGK